MSQWIFGMGRCLSRYRRREMSLWILGMERCLCGEWEWRDVSVGSSGKEMSQWIAGMERCLWILGVERSQWIVEMERCLSGQQGWRDASKFNSQNPDGGSQPCKMRQFSLLVCRHTWRQRTHVYKKYINKSLKMQKIYQNVVSTK